MLVHGLDDTEQVFNTMTTYLEERGWTVYRCSLIPSGGQVPLEALGRQLQRYIDHHLPDTPFDLLGFSMGGLISRYYVQRLGGLNRVHRLMTLSSPHRGTLTGYLRWNIGCSQMRPNSDFLRDLNQDWHTLEQVRFVSLWTPLDLMIVPATSSVIPVGTSQTIPVPLHPWMLTDKQVLETLVQYLETP
jgi:triacylglycerol lipase